MDWHQFLLQKLPKSLIHSSHEVVHFLLPLRLTLSVILLDLACMELECHLDFLMLSQYGSFDRLEFLFELAKQG
jgi:hypothetical protein